MFVIYFIFYAIVMEGNSFNAEKREVVSNAEVEKKSSTSAVSDKSLLDILSEKWDSDRLKEEDTLDNLIASFAVDYLSETMLKKWMHWDGLGNEFVMDIKSFARNLDDIKWGLVDLGENTEWIDKVMCRVKNYVMYWASNLTEPKKDENNPKIDIVLND